MTDKTPFGNLFINAGAMKAGTTWLYWVLRMNPDLYFSMEKEIHYFHRKYLGDAILNDTHRLNQMRSIYTPHMCSAETTIEDLRDQLVWLQHYMSDPMDDAWYARVMRISGKQMYACDFSNLYSQLPGPAWAEIQAQCSKLRVLFVLRDPLCRLWSHMKFDLKFNGQLSLLAEWSPSQYEAYLRQPHIWENAEYGQAIRRMKSGLSADSVHFEFLDEQQGDTLGLIRRVERFLGIRAQDYPEWVLGDKVNQSDPLPMPDFLPGLFRGDVDRIKDEMFNAGIEPPADWL